MVAAAAESINFRVG